MMNSLEARPVRLLHLRMSISHLQQILWLAYKDGAASRHSLQELVSEPSHLSLSSRGLLPPLGQVDVSAAPQQNIAEFR